MVFVTCSLLPGAGLHADMGPSHPGDLPLRAFPVRDGRNRRYTPA